MKKIIVKNKLNKNIICDKIEIEDKTFLHKSHSSHDKNKFHIKLIIKSKQLKAKSKIQSTKKILAEEVYQKLKRNRIDVLLDDRDERAGMKFKDADLIGIPWRIVVGRDSSSGLVELHNRKTKNTESLDISSVFNKLSEEINPVKL